MAGKQKTRDRGTMKKILVIAPYPYLPFFSGGQKFIAKILEFLARETDLTVVSTEGNDWSLAKGYRSIALLKSSFSRYYDASLVNKICTLVQQEKFDSLICEHPYMAWLAYRIRKRTGIQIILHTHNIEYQRFRSLGKWWWPLLKVYEKRSFRRADSIFFITPEDKQFAITKWGIPESRCLDVPFGIEISHHPTDRDASRKHIEQKHLIKPGEKILSFNGLLNYKPNLDALRIILDRINPLLLKQKDFRYKIIVCGKHLPDEMDGLKSYADKNIIFAGFTEDISTYLKATDVFLNPVQAGGGIKTKIVEAIGYGATVVSTETGAIGMKSAICGNKLVTVKDNDWEKFAEALIIQSGISSPAPAAYYDQYYWGNIAASIAKIIAAK